MNACTNSEELNHALQRCGAGWSAEQAHGLLCGRLSLLGRAAGVEWLGMVLEQADAGSGRTRECAALLETLFATTHQQLAERQSEFEPLLPDDDDSAQVRAAALAHWCEGFLHGLVSDVRNEQLKKRLADEPLCDIIRDMLEMTRATAEQGDEEEIESAYAELVEYLRVSAQLTYEELAGIRAAPSDEQASNTGAAGLH